MKVLFLNNYNNYYKLPIIMAKEGHVVFDSRSLVYENKDNEYTHELTDHGIIPLGDSMEDIVASMQHVDIVVNGDPTLWMHKKDFPHAQWVGPCPDTQHLELDKVKTKQLVEKLGIDVPPEWDSESKPLIIKSNKPNGTRVLVAMDPDETPYEDPYLEQYIPPLMEVNVYFNCYQGKYKIIHVNRQDGEHRNKTSINQPWFFNTSTSHVKNPYRIECLERAQKIIENLIPEDSHIDHGQIQFLVSRDEKIYFLEMNIRPGQYKTFPYTENYDWLDVDYRNHYELILNNYIIHSIQEWKHEYKPNGILKKGDRYYHRWGSHVMVKQEELNSIVNYIDKRPEINAIFGTYE